MPNRRIVLDLDERTDAALQAAAVRVSDRTGRRLSVGAVDRARREQAALIFSAGLRASGYLPDPEAGR